MPPTGSAEPDLQRVLECSSRAWLGDINTQYDRHHCNAADAVLEEHSEWTIAMPSQVYQLVHWASLSPILSVLIAEYGARTIELFQMLCRFRFELEKAFRWSATESNTVLAC